MVRFALDLPARWKSMDASGGEKERERRLLKIFWNVEDKNQRTREQ